MPLTVARLWPKYKENTYIYHSIQNKPVVISLKQIGHLKQNIFGHFLLVDR